MATSRVLKIKNNPPDLVALSQSRYNLQVAKSVIKDGHLVFNLIWKSTVLAPNMTIKWKPTYGLNWTADVPAEGLSITLGGNWKQCDPGQVLDLDANGLWTQSTKTPTIDFLAIGNNGYKSGTETNGIRIVIGIQGAPGLFDPIFVDTTELGTGMSATYQPQEKVQWWFEAGVLSSTMISSSSVKKETGDFSAPEPKTGAYSLTSSYSFKDGMWSTTAP